MFELDVDSLNIGCNVMEFSLVYKLQIASQTTKTHTYVKSDSNTFEPNIIFYDLDSVQFNFIIC